MGQVPGEVALYILVTDSITFSNCGFQGFSCKYLLPEWTYLALTNY